VEKFVCDHGLLFISEATDVFCRAGSDQQAQQSTQLAERLTPL